METTMLAGNSRPRGNWRSVVPAVPYSIQQQCSSGARRGRTMGVLEPVPEAFTEEVPATPPGFRDLGPEDNSEDDLFAEPQDQKNPPTHTYGNDMSFQSILPVVLPAKGDFTGYLGNLWELQKPPAKEKYCSGCVEDVKNDLKKIREVIEVFRKERDAATEENKALKKEIEQLKKLLYKKDLSEKGDVRITVSNGGSQNVDVLVKKKDTIQSTHDALGGKNMLLKNSPIYGVQSFSISLPKENVRPPKTKIVEFQLPEEAKSKKTVAQLRKEFFEKEFESEQTKFISRNYMEVKPVEPKELVRSKMTIRVKPKRKVTEIISKLASKFSGSKIIPEAPPINMFQRFEKTRIVWENGLERKIIA